MKVNWIFSLLDITFDFEDLKFVCRIVCVTGYCIIKNIDRFYKNINSCLHRVNGINLFGNNKLKLKRSEKEKLGWNSK